MTTLGLILSTIAQLNFFVCFFRNTAITISKVDTKKTSYKAVFLQSCILDVLPKHRNIMAHTDLNIFGECVTRKKSSPLLAEGTVKCTSAAPLENHKGCQLK